MRTEVATTVGPSYPAQQNHARSKLQCFPKRASVPAATLDRIKAMAAVPNQPRVSVQDYLDGDDPREYVDGFVLERNVGSPKHSALQKILIVYLAAFEKKL